MSSFGVRLKASGPMSHRMRNMRVVLSLAGALFVASLANVFTAPQVPSAPQALKAPQAPPADAGKQLATINQYCVACHNDRAKTAGVSFQGLTAESIGQQAEVFEKAVRKMR